MTTTNFLTKFVAAITRSDVISLKLKC